MRNSIETSMLLAAKAPYEDAAGIREFELKTLQLANGIIPLVGEINTDTAIEFISTLHHLYTQQKEAKIYLCTNGGSIVPGLAIVDAIRAYPYPLSILCVSMAASMGAVILASGPKGRRFILPHSKVMIHEPLIAGGLGGSVTTIEKTAHSMIETKNMINNLLSEYTGKTIAEIDEATSFDNYMSAEEAIQFGLCDAIRSPYDM